MVHSVAAPAAGHDAADTRLAWRARVAALLFALLVAALAGLVVAFAISARGANRQFTQASLSERQAAVVARIVALAPAGQGPALERALADYRALVAEEVGLARGPTLTREQIRADALVQLARTPGAQMRLEALARTIDGQENGELQAGRRALDEVGLGHLADQAAGSLTLSNQKRLEIARALATGAKLLLLDEVMAGLTATEVAQMSETLFRLRQERKLTILIIEHVMGALMNLSDRILVLDHGVPIAMGPPEQVVADENVIRVYFG